MSSNEGRTVVTILCVGVVGMLLAVRDVAALDCQAAKTQLEIEQCATTRLQEVGAQLERAYTKYLQGLQAEDRDRLVKAQHAWEAYRDLDCEAAAATYGGGTMGPTELVACKSRLTTERLEELNRIYAEPPLPGASGPK